MSSAVVNWDWFGSLAKWGQFLTNKFELRPEAVEKFQLKTSAAKSLEDLKNSFQHQTIQTRASIERYYEFYQV